MSKVGNRTGSVKAQRPTLGALGGPERGEPPVEPPSVDAPTGRRYREVPVRAVDLPPSFVEAEGGAFTRKGTPRLDLLCAARAAFLQRKEDANEYDAIRYDSGRHAVRKEGMIIKSIQGFAEDVWRRVYKRPLPQEDPLDDPDFRRFYDRTRRALKRSDLVEEEGPAVPDPNKFVRDAHGKRWRLSEALREAERGRETADPPSFVRCTGPPIEDDTAGVWARVERRIARENELHRACTHAGTAHEVSEHSWRHRVAHGRRYERRHARNGTEAARHVTVGRWREEAARRNDRGKHAVRCPWVVFELDAKTREENDRLARQLCRRLEDLDVNVEDVLVAYSGNKSLHVRVPDGCLGCPLYVDGRAARRKLRTLVHEVAGGNEALVDALDMGLCSPGRTIRAIGSVHPSTERHTVACTADVFLDKSPSYLWALSESEYTPPNEHPLPRNATFAPALARLLDPTITPPSRGGLKLNVQQSSSGSMGQVVMSSSVRDGVEEGRRNEVALRVAHVLLFREDGQRGAWRRLREWNRRCDPPLALTELHRVFESAARFQVGLVDVGEDGRGPPRSNGRSESRVYSVFGDTYTHREVLKENGFWWDAEQGVWRTKNPLAFRRVVKGKGLDVSPLVPAVPCGRDAARIPAS